MMSTVSHFTSAVFNSQGWTSLRTPRQLDCGSPLKTSTVQKQVVASDTAQLEVVCRSRVQANVASGKNSCCARWCQQDTDDDQSGMTDAHNVQLLDGAVNLQKCSTKVPLICVDLLTSQLSTEVKGVDGGKQKRAELGSVCGKEDLFCVLCCASLHSTRAHSSFSPLVYFQDKA